MWVKFSDACGCLLRAPTPRPVPAQTSQNEGRWREGACKPRYLHVGTGREEEDAAENKDETRYARRRSGPKTCLGRLRDVSQDCRATGGICSLRATSHSPHSRCSRKLTLWQVLAYLHLLPPMLLLAAAHAPDVAQIWIRHTRCSLHGMHAVGIAKYSLSHVRRGTACSPLWDISSDHWIP
jgi:hypothetical protein